MLTVLPAQVEHSDFASAHRPWYPCLAGRDAGTDRTPAAGWRKSGLTEQDSSPVPEGHACTCVPFFNLASPRRGRRTIFLPQPLKAGCAHPICRVSPAHLSMRGFIVAAALALTMDEC